MRAAAVAVLAVVLFSLAVATPPLRLPPSLRQSARPRVPPSFNLNSGGSSNTRFDLDAPYVVGETFVSDMTNVNIGGAEDKNRIIYHSHRYGNNGSVWGYDIPVMRPGMYNCTAHFAETDVPSFRPGARVFRLVFATSLENPIVFDNVDVFAATKAKFVVYTRTATMMVIPGVLYIRLYPIVGNAFMSGLTCERASGLPQGVQPDYTSQPRLPADPLSEPGPEPSPDSAPALFELSINCGGPAIGRFIAEDYSWIVGKTSMWEGPPGITIGGTEERNREAVKSHRYGLNGGAFGYRIPIDRPGTYECSFYFSETDSESFSVGARVFDLDVMGQRLNNLDIFKMTGEAEFVAVVRTFSNLQLSNELKIDLIPRVGNTFISAIVCLLKSEASPNLPDVDTSPDPSIPSEVFPTTEPSPDSDGSTAEPSMTPAMTPSTEATPSSDIIPVEPTVEPSTSTEPDTEAPSPSADVAGASGEVPTVIISPSPSLAKPDQRITPNPGESQQPLQLTVLVAGEGGLPFTDSMKVALLQSLKNAANEPSSRIALVDIREVTESRLLKKSRLLVHQGTRQGGPVQVASSHNADVQVVASEEKTSDAVSRISNSVKKGDVSASMRSLGHPNVEVSLRSTTTKADSPAAAGSSTAGVVGGVVGGGLLVLIILAVGVFMFVQRRKGNENAGGGFDGPPPALSESEASVIERSETAASVEYLDDDSTFTAATSRAGEHVDQVSFVKDVFGRGTSVGTHGVS